MEETSKLKKIIEQWQHSTIEYLPRVLLAIVVVVVFWLLARYLNKLIRKVYHAFFRGKRDVQKITGIVVYVILLLIGVFIALEILGLEDILTKLITSAGIVGIIAGFAFKDIISNTFSGLLLYIQRPFNEGDWIRIDNTYGRVESINWITTAIYTTHGQRVFVPNQLVYSSTFTNYSSYGIRRIVFKTGVSYGDDLEKVKKIAIEEARKIPSLYKNKPIDFYFTDIGSSAYNFELRFWIKFKENIDYLTAMSNIIMGIKKRFEQENISIAYNVTTLDFGVKGGVNVFDKEIKITGEDKP